MSAVLLTRSGEPADLMPASTNPVEQNSITPSATLLLAKWWWWELGQKGRRRRGKLCCWCFSVICWWQRWNPSDLVTLQAEKEWNTDIHSHAVTSKPTHPAKAVEQLWGPLLRKPSILQLIPSANAEVVERMLPPVILGINKPKWRCLHPAILHTPVGQPDRCVLGSSSAVV